MAPTILVIDDDPVVRRLITTILERNDYQVAAVSGVAEALNIIDQQRPDAVCCDLLMPEPASTSWSVSMRATIWLIYRWSLSRPLARKT